jgi:2,4-dienoyl-CoA reductase-like NADH-dependent reductase (Old Yellow Enzyme family)
MGEMNDRSILFREARLGSLALPNRFVRSATHDFLAEDDGRATARQVGLYRELARGEVGLIITGHAFVNPAGRASPRQLGAHEDRMVEGLGSLAGAVHEFPSRIFLQIAHAGRQTKERICGCVPVAPSAVFDPATKVMPRDLSPEEIRALIEDFVAAARRAGEAGFDGVQLHAAHGYLLSSFLSPHTNRRQDEWGGSLEKRARVLIKIIRKVRGEFGRAFPLIVKLNSSDFLEGGLTVADAVQIAPMLEAAGLDGIEVSGGTAEAGRGSMWEGLRAEEDEGYFVPAASEIKAAVRIPVFGLGGWRTLRAMEQAVREGRADFISLSRPLVRDPHLIRKFRIGEVGRSDCISCNKCLNPRGLRCGQRV